MNHHVSMAEQVAARNARRGAVPPAEPAVVMLAGSRVLKRAKARAPMAGGAGSRRVKAALAAEDRLAVAAVAHWARAGLPVPVRQHRFHPERQWRFDQAWPGHKIAIEVQGGVFIKGGHNRGAQLVKEYEKYRAAAELGWRILPITPRELLGATFTEQLKRILSADFTD